MSNNANIRDAKYNLIFFDFIRIVILYQHEQQQIHYIYIPENATVNVTGVVRSL